jgi:type I restriction enzyme S subunit
MEQVRKGEALKLPKGYKQTEVGVIPDDWEQKDIQEVARVIGGGTPNTNISEFWNGQINWFTPTEIKENKYSCESRRKISQKGLENSSAKLLPAGTLLMTSRATIGDFSILTNEATTNQGFQSLLANDLINNEFLYYLMFTKVNEIVLNSSGSTFLEISPKKVNKIKIPLPPTLTEQKAIAMALSDVDALISKLDSLIAKKQAIKQGAMQQLLTGKQRLSGFDGKWVEKKVINMGEIVTGGTPPTVNKENWNGNLPWITPTDISDSKDIYFGERTITKTGISTIPSLPKNTLLVTCIASIGKNAILRHDGACNQQINAIIPNDKHNVEFLYYLIELHKDMFKSNAGTTATSIISKKEFGEFKFYVPSIYEQNEIVQVISDMDANIEFIKSKKSKYSRIKEGMMQELLTGKTRLV